MSYSTLASQHLIDRSRVFINQNSHTWLVLHKTGGTPDLPSLSNYFATGTAMASTHYGVGQDGQIWQFVLEQDGAGGNCCLEAGHAAFLPTNTNLNWLTISIEHIDPSLDNSTPLTDAQKRASFALVKDICTRNTIPMRAGDGNGGILGHYQLDPLSRARCPGNYPWQELFTYLDGGIMIPANWKDDAATRTLTAPNGIAVKLGFRDYILSHPWDPANVPTSPEYHLDNLEESNPAIGAGQKQVFLFGDALEYTTSRGVFRAWNGREFDFMVHENNQLASQVQTLQQQLQTYQNEAQLLAMLKQQVSTLESDTSALKSTLGM